MGKEQQNERAGDRSTHTHTRARAGITDRVLRGLAQGGLAYVGRLPKKDGMHAEPPSSLKEGRGEGSQMPEHSEQRPVTQLVQGAFMFKSACERHKS